MRPKKHVFIFLLTFFTSLNVLFATNRYVKPTGNDTNNGLSLQTAYATLQQAHDDSQPGDTIWVADGTYSHVIVTRSGSPTQPIVYKSINKWGAKIATASNNGCFNISNYNGSTATDFTYGVSYIVIDGFDLKNTNYSGNGVVAEHAAHHITVQNCYAHDCGQSGIQLNNGDYRFIYNNVCNGNGFLLYEAGSGISLYGMIEFDNLPGWHNIISGNICNENFNGPTTANTDGNGIIIDDFRNTQNMAGHVGATPNLVTYTGKETLVENNLCARNGGAGIQNYLCNNIVVRNNTCYLNQRRKTNETWRGNLSVSCCTNVKFANNISVVSSAANFDGGGANSFYSFNTAIGVFCLNTGNERGGNCTFYNNIAYDINKPTDSSIQINNNNSGIVFDRINGVNGNKCGVNPLFVNVTPSYPGTDFHLQSNSPAINAGTSAYGLPTLDLDGNQRVQGSAVDIGCYEAAGTTDTQAPTAPTALASSNIAATSFTLSWAASTDNVGVVSYEVFSGTVSRGTTAGTSLSITGLTASTAYAMTVRAKDQAGNVSAASATLNVTTGSGADTQAPTAPTSLASSNIAATSFTLSWAASTDNVGVVSYEVFSGTVSRGTTAGTSLSITGLTASTAYAMTVRAKDQAGNVSPASATLNVTTTAGTTTGAADITIQAESFCSQTGLSTWSTGIGGFGSGTSARYCSVNLAGGYTSLVFNLATTQSGTIFVRTGSTTGTTIGTLNFTTTGGWDTYQQVTISLTGASGIQDVFLVGSSGSINLDWIKFTGGSGASTVAVTGVTISPKTLTLTVGATSTLSATVVPVTATNKTVTFASSNTAFATVNATSGLVTAIAPGTATITVSTNATDGVKTDVCTVQVNPTVPVNSIRIEGENYNTKSAGTTNCTTCSPAYSGEYWNGGWTAYSNVNLGTGFTFCNLRIATTNSGTVQIRDGSATGTILGTASFTSSGGWATWKNVAVSLTGASGVKNIFITVVSNSSFNLDWLEFSNTALRPSREVLTANDTELKLFPNPVSAKGQLRIVSKSAELNSVVIFDQNGRIRLNKMLAGSVSLSVTELNLTPGVYILTIKNNNGTKLKKLVVY